MIGQPAIRIIVSSLNDLSQMREEFPGETILMKKFKGSRGTVHWKWSAKFSLSLDEDDNADLSSLPEVIQSVSDLLANDSGVIGKTIALDLPSGLLMSATLHSESIMALSECGFDFGFQIFKYSGLR